MRSPASFFDHSTFSPPLLPRMLTKPPRFASASPWLLRSQRTSRPLARLISGMTSAFLLARSALGLLAGFLARSAFFPRLAFWRPCACASPRERLDAALSPRRLCSCSSVSPGPGCGRHIHHPGSEKLQPESLVIKPAGRLSRCGGTELAGWVSFHKRDKNTHDQLENLKCLSDCSILSKSPLLDCPLSAFFCTSSS